MRSSFGPSQLVRLFGGWAPVEAEASGMDFAERMGLWLNAFDAIRLQQALRSAGCANPMGLRTTAARLRDDIARTRSALTKAIAQDPLAYAEPAAGYAPWRDRHLDLQRQMEMMITPLREHVREAAAVVSPRLRQLAALDAALEEVLAARTQALLPTAAHLLERRFAEMEPQERQDHFAHDWRQALHAELDLRLEPVAGLVEAVAAETNKQP